jgi:hypothetical protein
LNLTPDRLVEAWEAHSLNRVQRGVDGGLSSSTFVGFRKEMLWWQKRHDTSMVGITSGDHKIVTSCCGMVANSTVNPPSNEGEMMTKGRDLVAAAETSYNNRTTRGTVKTSYNTDGIGLHEGTCDKGQAEVGSPGSRWLTISIVDPPTATGKSSSVASGDGGL